MGNACTVQPAAGLPDEAYLLNGADGLACLLVDAVRIVALPDGEWSREVSADLRRRAKRLQARKDSMSPRSDLAIKAFLGALSYPSGDVMSHDLEMMQGLDSFQVEAALLAVWRHRDAAQCLVEIMKHPLSHKRAASVGRWVSAGVLLSELLSLDPHLNVAGPGIIAYRQRQREGEVVVLERVLAGLRSVLRRIRL